MSYPHPKFRYAVLGILIFITLLALAIGRARATMGLSSAPVGTNGVTWAGMYLDETSYEPGDTISIHASASDVPTVFRLVRLDQDWTEITRTLPMTVGLQSTYVGSFLEYPTVSLSGRSAFTLEGWYHPTLMGGDPDTTVVAGQIGVSEAAAGIVILEDGRMAGYVSDSAVPSPTKLAIAPAPGDFTVWLDSWHHLALTYDGAQVNLYIDGALAAQRTQTGSVAAVSIPFRVGARAEAPCDQTGILDGRIDSWTLWPTTLSLSEVGNRMQRGLLEDNPEPVDLSAVDLYLAFEGPYPSITDSPSSGHAGTIFNHGNPGVSGVTLDGIGFRLNSDQLVDAGWSLTAQLIIPANLDSGMYAIQGLLGPGYLATQDSDIMAVRSIAIRPANAATKAPIAVVLPTNTWNAYNTWPGKFPGYLVGPGLTSRGRYPGAPTRLAGNNSAYQYMVDDVSSPFFQGQRRPATTFSPTARGDGIANYRVRAPNSMFMVQWLDAMGFDYDVYSDDDFSAGLIVAEDYKVLMPHSHHEYWTDGMLANLTQFLDDGGSVAMPAGNVFTWRSVYNDDRVMEVRKFTKFLVLGEQDLKSGIDGQYTGLLRQSAACNASGDSYRELGVRIHLTGPCNAKPFCFGEWEAQNTDHWLWQGSGLQELDTFGIGRPADVLTPTFAVGHEADTWLPGMLVPGLSSGQEPTILGEGINFNHVVSDTIGQNGLLLDPNHETSCDDVKDSIGVPVGAGTKTPATRGGTILYFEHAGGGHVLVIGASATPWALESNTSLSGLLFRGLDCFVNANGCGYDLFLPIGQRK